MAEEKVRAGLDRVLVLEVARVTEVAAIAAARWRGKGSNKAADKAAVDAMRKQLGKVHSAAPSSSARARWTRRRCCTSARRSAPARA